MKLQISEQVDKLLKSESTEDNELGMYLIIDQFPTRADFTKFFFIKMDDYHHIWYNLVIGDFWQKHKGKK